MPIFAQHPDLLLRFRAGDRDALETVYRLCLPDVTAAIVQMCGLPTRREARRRSGTRPIQPADCIQEVFVRAFTPRARAAFDGQRAYGPYMLTIARNVVIDEFRRQRREILMAASDLEMLLLQMPEEAPDEGLALPYGTVVRRFVTALDPGMRALLDARYARGLSQERAAAELGLSRQRVRTLETNLHKRLRQRIGGGRGRRAGAVEAMGEVAGRG